MRNARWWWFALLRATAKPLEQGCRNRGDGGNSPSPRFCRLVMWRAHGLPAVGLCRVKRQDSSGRHPINTAADLATAQYLLTWRRIKNKPSRWKTRPQLILFKSGLWADYSQAISICSPVFWLSYGSAWCAQMLISKSAGSSCSSEWHFLLGDV